MSPVVVIFSTLLPRTLDFLPPSYKDPWGFKRPSEIRRDNHPISTAESHLQSPFHHAIQYKHRFGRLGPGHLQRGYNYLCLYHEGTNCFFFRGWAGLCFPWLSLSSFMKRTSLLTISRKLVERYLICTSFQLLMSGRGRKWSWLNICLVRYTSFDELLCNSNFEGHLHHGGDEYVLSFSGSATALFTLLIPTCERNTCKQEELLLHVFMIFWDLLLLFLGSYFQFQSLFSHGLNVVGFYLWCFLSLPGVKVVALICGHAWP